MTFEWDPEKASANLRKHGVRFADAVAVLEDARAITVPDESSGEERWITHGRRNTTSAKVNGGR